MNGELAWRKSSYSDDQGGNCVEVAGLPYGVTLRDSKVRSGPRLTLTVAAWDALLTATTAAARG